jgi:hydroxyacylglutathione hydrolase
MMEVIRIVNKYRQANTFIINTGQKKVTVVDVGGPDIELLTTWLAENNKVVEAVLLTHEHADHCVGLNSLFEVAPFDIFCSQACSVNIKNSKQNFSFYSDEIPTFEIQHPVKIINENDRMEVGNLTISGIETPGHSPGGICFLINDAMFTGDTVLNRVVPPLSFPHSNRQDYKTSLVKLKKYLRNDLVIYPGHGESFTVDNAFLNHFVD